MTMKKIEKIYIYASDYPDWDYVIDNLINLSDKINEIIDVVNSQQETLGDAEDWTKNPI